MNSLELALRGAGSVLVAGLLFGAGLPVVYAVALRALTVGATTTTDADGSERAHPSAAGRVLSALLVLVVVGGIVLGLMMIVAAGLGKTVTFDSLVPMLTDGN